MKESTLEKIQKQANQNPKFIRGLKNLAVEIQDYELSVELREIELRLFPDKLTGTPDLKEAKKMQTALGMVDLNTSLKQSWIISELFKAYNEKGGEFGIEEATTIVNLANEKFG